VDPGTSNDPYILSTSNYEENGLILHCDAINNTENGHSNNTTTWKDISGNSNDGVLTNFNFTSTSGWTSKGLVFDGVDDGVYVGDKLINLFKTNNTIEMVIKFDESGRDILVGNYNYVNTLNYEKDWNDVVFITLNYPEYNGFSTDILSTGNIKSLSFAFDKTQNKIILKNNNALFYTFSSPLIGSYSYDWKSGWFGKDYRTGTTVLKGTIYSIRVYNRVLNDNEIEKNYEVDKARFEF
jgi:hypothetical protein